MKPDLKTSIYKSIPGGTELLLWFGDVPRFHDAEVESISLNRAKPSHLILHLSKMAEKIGIDGFLVVEKRAAVTFVFEEIVELQIDGFNHQNVISELRLNWVSTVSGISIGNHQAERPEVYELLLEHCFGLSGYISARNISVSYEPYSL